MGLRGPKPASMQTAFLRMQKRATREGACLLVNYGASVGIGYKLLNYEGTYDYAHRVAFTIHNGKPPTGVVRHSCDRPNCIEGAHLLDGTHADNVNDKVSRRRHGHGSTHYQAILNEQMVRDLRAMPKPNFRQLAAQYLMSVGALKSAYYGHTWKHVKKDPSE